MSEFESSPRNHTERTELTASQLAIQKIECHLSGIESESPRFQAFADCVDFGEAANRVKNYPNMVDFKMEYYLMRETIRQRKNEPIGFNGYARDYETAERLLLKLISALDKDRNGGKDVINLHTSLETIKNNVITRRNTSKPITK